MRIDILTLFPPLFDSVFSHSIIGRARERQLIDIRVHNMRDYTHDKHHIVDDYPYGGGAGMVLKPEPVFEAVEAVKQDAIDLSSHTVLLSPQGRLFNQEIAKEMTGYDNLIIICGRYEGVDERVAEYLASDVISIGDYVLSGGEVAAMVMVESIVRLLHGVVGSEESIVEDSHSDGLLEYPHYTRPPSYRGWQVPEVLLSGNHAEIARWRRYQRIVRTAKRRPDLIDKAVLSQDEMNLIKEMIYKNS
ncbi:MAG TPA: tRNA (guanosine(37)-N1)-methyltransferase TrmD [Dehalococcoidia bacterium]|nr:tRNA (guanosine(37)-N1)-methyltransferase TrmD [Dehalococcoidia bacterium]